MGGVGAGVRLIGGDGAEVEKVAAISVAVDANEGRRVWSSKDDTGGGVI